MYSPASFEQLWRSGALPALVVTLAKRAAQCDLDDVVGVGGLVALLEPPPGQREPWYAASAEWTQLALFILARLGGRAAARVLPLVLNPPAPQVLEDLMYADDLPMLMDALQAGALQLGRQPVLRRLLEVAAPALLPDADGLRDCISQHAASGSRRRRGQQSSGHAALSAPPQPPRLLADLACQLDPLALGLALPGCYNPACTSLAGASEGAMKLQRCSSCGIARWAGGVMSAQCPWSVWQQQAHTALLARAAGTATPPAPRRTGSTTRPAASARRQPGQRQPTCSSRSEPGGSQQHG
jgi:hypothetical protein